MMTPKMVAFIAFIAGTSARTEEQIKAATAIMLKGMSQEESVALATLLLGEKTTGAMLVEGYQSL